MHWYLPYSFMQVKYGELIAMDNPAEFSSK